MYSARSYLESLQSVLFFVMVPVPVAVILMEARREQLRDYYNKELLQSGCGFSVDKARDMLTWANRAWEANGDSNRMVDIKNPEYKEDPAEVSGKRISLSRTQ